MPLTEAEELELLELEEEEYQESLRQQTTPTVPTQTPSDSGQDKFNQLFQKLRDIEKQESKIGEARQFGAIKSGTLGFADELGAIGDVALDAVKGEPITNLLPKWREYQQAREKSAKEKEDILKETMPGQMLIGELSTGLIPGVGLSGKAAKATQTLKGLERASALGKLSAKTGAILGGVAGAGQSEATIEDSPSQLIGDIASGMGAGGLLGFGLGLAGGGVASLGEKMAKYIADKPYLRQVLTARQTGKQGIDYGSDIQSGKLAKEQQRLIPAKIEKELYDIDRSLGKEIGKSIQDAEQQGIKINIDDELNQINDEISDLIYKPVKNEIGEVVGADYTEIGKLLSPKARNIIRKIKQKETGDLTPTEAKAIKDDLYTLIGDLADNPTAANKTAINLGASLASALDNKLINNVEGYKAANQAFRLFRSKITEPIISKGIPSEYGAVYLGDLKKPRVKLLSGIRDLLHYTKMPGASAEAERATLQTLKDNLAALQKAQQRTIKTEVPSEAVKRLEKQKELTARGQNIISDLEKQADLIATRIQAIGESPQPGLSQAIRSGGLGLSTAGRGLSMSLAQKAGAAERKIGAPVSKIYRATEEQLIGLSKALKDAKATRYFGEKLESAIANKDEFAKNTVLFKLMQDPQYRNMLKSSGVEEEDNE